MGEELCCFSCQLMNYSNNIWFQKVNLFVRDETRVCFKSLNKINFFTSGKTW